MNHQLGFLKTKLYRGFSWQEGFKLCRCLHWCLNKVYQENTSFKSVICFAIAYLAQIMLNNFFFFSRLVCLPWYPSTHQLIRSRNILVRQKRENPLCQALAWSLRQEVCGEVGSTPSFLSPKPGSLGLRSLIYEARTRYKWTDWVRGYLQFLGICPH